MYKLKLSPNSERLVSVVLSMVNESRRRMDTYSKEKRDSLEKVARQTILATQVG